MLRAGLDTGCSLLRLGKFPLLPGALRLIGDGLPQSSRPGQTFGCTSFRAAAALTICLFLDACSTSAPPVSAQPPAPILRPSVQVFSADWTKQPLHIAYGCVKGGVFDCSDLPLDAEWAGYQQCLDPTPNVCFTPHDGVMDFTAGDPGYALVSAYALPTSGVISIRAVITARNNCNPVSDVSFVGPVIYAGEGASIDPDGDYAALYIECFNGALPRLVIYRPSLTNPVSQVAIVPGSTHELGIDWDIGNGITYSDNGVVVFTETSVFDPADGLTLKRAPHPALWFGSVAGTVRSFDVTVGP